MRLSYFLSDDDKNEQIKTLKLANIHAMAILPITVTGDPVLHRVNKPVEKFDDQLRALVADMFETMRAAPGVGLAAPQVGIDARIFVYEWEDENGMEHKGVAVNPELLVSPCPLDQLTHDNDDEGCLSVPGYRFPTRRAERALLRAYDEYGKPYELEAEGWLARIWQHEYDHLGGILYVDRLEGKMRSAAQKAIRREGWGVPGLTWDPAKDDIDA